MVAVTCLKHVHKCHEKNCFFFFFCFFFVYAKTKMQISCAVTANCTTYQRLFICYLDSTTSSSETQNCKPGSVASIGRFVSDLVGKETPKTGLLIIVFWLICSLPCQASESKILLRSLLCP